MGFLDRVTNMLTRGGRDENLLREGLEHAKAKRPEKAMEIYTSLIDSKSTSASVRARALFNRALAHSSLDDDERARTDLEKALTLPGLPENVQTAARNQLARIKRRSEA